MKRIVRFTHDPGWGYRIEPLLSGVAEVTSITARSKEEAVAAAAGADMLLITSLGQRALFTPDTVEQLASVRVIYVTGVGWDPIEPESCTRQDIILANNPEFCTYEVAEHTLALIFSIMRKVPFAHAAVKSKGHADWQEFAPMHRLHGKTAGVIGFGRSGRQVSRGLTALGLNVLVCDHHAAAKKPVMDSIGVVPAVLDELLRNADIVTLHVPLTDATRGMIGERELRLMKSSAVLINTSRGHVVDEAALVAALRDGTVRAAGLDVFAAEPLPQDSPLLALDNVVLTPHLASTSEESVSLEDLANEVKRVIAGERPSSIVNPEVLSR